MVVIVAIAGYSLYTSLNKEVEVSDLTLANVEALARSENGTAVEYCYLQQAFGTTSGYKKFCDSETSDSRIYPCPSSITYGIYSESARDRCTK